MKKLKFLLLTLFISLRIFNVSAQNPDDEKFQNIDAFEFRELISAFDHEVIIDASNWKLYKKSRIHGAVSAQSPDELDKIIETLDFEQPIFVYSEKGNISINPCLILLGLGFKEVYHLKGGFQTWKDAGYEFDEKRVWRFLDFFKCECEN